MIRPTDFLPTTLAEARAKGWDELDVILITADDYVDHPSFGMAIVGRYLESLGLRVGIIPRPIVDNNDDFTVLGIPKMFFGVTAGNLDSMVSKYTAARKIRSDDPYAAGGLAQGRPYLPSIVYTNKIKSLFKNVPVVLGGIEASLRRTAHYDHYHGRVRPSVLLAAKADMLVYGNGEAPLKDLVGRLRDGTPFDAIHDIRGTAIPVNAGKRELIADARILPSYEVVSDNADAFNDMTRIIMEELNPHNAKPLAQDTAGRAVRINPPAFALSTVELDAAFDLPYTRKAHPRYTKTIPALAVIENSIISHRGCYGGCSFCALALHQGKTIQSRSKVSVEREIKTISAQTGKPVVITDVGGPTANMYGTCCTSSEANKVCKRPSCLFPEICKHLDTSHANYRALLNELRNMPEAKRVYINSGIRYDLALRDEAFIAELAEHHTQGRLSTAPEHVDAGVLRIARKPSFAVYEKFARVFDGVSKRAGLKQYLVPYLIAGLPGETQQAAESLIRETRKPHMRSVQVQEFYPTPMTIAAAMYYTGKDPFTGEKVHIEKSERVKRMRKRRIVR
ncbi:MAG: YgiQ family radical SAM protein [Spirochaetes bacterium]|nr:YgiQ family radical SAM protein [Spirochaetota bacterium]